MIFDIRGLPQMISTAQRLVTSQRRGSRDRSSPTLEPLIRPSPTPISEVWPATDVSALFGSGRESALPLDAACSNCKRTGPINFSWFSSLATARLATPVCPDVFGGPKNDCDRGFCFTVGFVSDLRHCWRTADLKASGLGSSLGYRNRGWSPSALEIERSFSYTAIRRMLSLLGSLSSMALTQQA